MKDFLFDALMLLVGCLLWVIVAVMMFGIYGIVTWIFYQLAEFGNFKVLLLWLAVAVLLALIVAMIRFARRFWLTYC